MNLKYKHKVLLVPAWYPASFFTEQMKLVDDAFEFKVLIGEKHELGKKKAIKKILTGRFNQFTWKKNKSVVEDRDIINVDYFYVNSLPAFFERKQYKYLNRCFENKFQELIETGWIPELIHIQSLSDTSVFVCNWAEKNKVPIILTEHIVFVRCKFDFFQKEKERVYNRVNKVLCVSNYVYRNLLINGFKLKSVGIIGNLVDDKFVPSSFDKKQKTNKMLFVATHLADKDIGVLLQAIKNLINLNFTDFKIDILGIDPNKFYYNDSNNNYFLKQEVDNLGLSEYFDIRGIVTREDLLKSYKNYSLLVSTSVSETFGLAIAEALSNGLPVICTDSGGPRDFVNENNGIIVPIRNPQSIADSIKKIFQNLNRYNSSQISSEIIVKYGRGAFSKIISKEYNQQIEETKY